MYSKMSSAKWCLFCPDLNPFIREDSLYIVILKTGYWFDSSWSSEPTHDWLQSPWTQHAQLVLSLNYFVQIRPIPWLIMAWLFGSPGHQQAANWSYISDRLMSLSEGVFDCLHQFHITLYWEDLINALASGKYGNNFRNIIFKLVLHNSCMDTCCVIALRWMSQNLTDEKST